jgi:hypothetical protein
VNDEGEIPGRKPLLLGIGGRSASMLGSIDLDDDVDLLVLDTDQRTEKRFGNLQTMIVGKAMVNGEGAGGNMNLARACFKMDMERIAPLILGRPLVMVIISTDGATGIAGAVEICSLLIKVGMPSFSILLHEETNPGGGMDPLHMASMLLDGPLRPGCILIKGMIAGSTEEDQFGIRSTLPFLLSGAGSGPDFPLTSISWNSMREDGGPFEIGSIPDLSGSSRVELGSPSIISLKVPFGLTTDEVRSILDASLGHIEGLHIALQVSPGIDLIHGAYIAKASKKPPLPSGPPPDPEMLKDLLGGPLDLEIEPNRNLP